MNTETNHYKIAWENMLLALETFGITFSKSQAERLVGSGKLLQLIEAGKIETDKPTPRQNGKWFCNAADVLRHCRRMENGTRSQTHKYKKR